MTRPLPLTDAEFIEILHDVERDVTIATRSFYTWSELNNIAFADPAILNKLNLDADFWNLTFNSLQTSFFVALGRIFDSRNPNAISIHKLVGGASRSPDIFSQAAHYSRKVVSGHDDADWLGDWLHGVHAPNIDELRAFRKYVQPAQTTYDRDYRAIRDSIYAHSLANRVVTTGLFSATLIGDVDDMLYVVNCTVRAYWELYHNGKLETLGTRTFNYQTDARQKAQALLDRLSAS